MTGPGTSGNVIAALCSFFIPGLGQLVQGRPFAALVHVCLAGIVWAVTFSTGGWIMHIVSALEAALHKRKA